MKIRQFQLMAYLCLFTVFGCTPSPTQTMEIATTTATYLPATDAPSIDFKINDFPKAQSLAMAGNSSGSLYLVYGQDHSLFVARSTDGGQTFGKAVLASGDTPVHVLPIEHPGIAAGNNGRVSVAWLEMPPDFNGATIWYAASEDNGQTFSPAQLVATEPEGEVAMVQVAMDDKSNPFLTWLNDSELKFARSSDQGATFSEAVSIGDGSCECCQPQLIVRGENIHIAYRSLEPGSDKGDIRDIVMVHSEDGGGTFQAVTRISDAHWYLPACPIAGPSLATRDENFYIAWMDGRFEPAGTFSRGDVWFSTSTDAGKTFSPNIRINADQSMHHTLPSIALGPEGRLHVAWEAQGAGAAFLYYTTSDDDGQTFTLPQVIADDTDSSRGNPGKAVLVVDPLGHVTLAWIDRLGVRIATWTDTQ